MYFESSLLRSWRTILFAVAHQHHVLFTCSEIVGSERHPGKLFVNEEWHFQEVAKGKYASTRVCLTMKTTDLVLNFSALLHLK